MPRGRLPHDRFGSRERRNRDIRPFTFGHLSVGAEAGRGQSPLKSSRYRKELGSSRPHHFLGPHQAVKFCRRDIAQTDRLFAQRRPISMRGLRDSRVGLSQVRGKHFPAPTAPAAWVAGPAAQIRICSNGKKLSGSCQYIFQARLAVARVVWLCFAHVERHFDQYR
jgi:hypothetical protein